MSMRNILHLLLFTLVFSATGYGKDLNNRFAIETTLFYKHTMNNTLPGVGIGVGVGYQMSNYTLFSEINLYQNSTTESGNYNHYEPDILYTEDHHSLKITSTALGGKWNLYRIHHLNIEVFHGLEFMKATELTTTGSFDNIPYLNHIDVTNELHVGFFTGMGLQYKISEKSALTAQYRPYLYITNWNFAHDIRISYQISI